MDFQLFLGYYFFMVIVNNSINSIQIFISLLHILFSHSAAMEMLCINAQIFFFFFSFLIQRDSDLRMTSSTTSVVTTAIYI